MEDESGPQALPTAGTMFGGSTEGTGVGFASSMCTFTIAEDIEISAVLDISVGS
jgi:hypothetical protein